MSGNQVERRLHPRKNCPGPILVYELTNGLPHAGELIDISRGGVRLWLDRSLKGGEAVRVFFPHRKCAELRQGRTIFGRVVHARSKRGGHIIRIAFGWNPAATQPQRPIRKDLHPSSIFHFFTRGLSRHAFSAWKRI
ncbi:MAG: PilZ domain-containing protein [Isosphaeraceae bacterium]